MSKQNHNYSQYSNKRRDANVGESAANAVKQNNQNQRQSNYPKQENRPRAISQEEVEKKYTPMAPAEPVKVVEESVKTVSLPETVEGRIINCAKLNVRENATVNSDIVCVLDTVSEFEVDVNRTTPTWAYIYTATGAEGYCMRQYVEAHL